ncbi:hypothetical protein M8C21_011889 [Ambrosia artemisiifolia]|uniref:Uncharacterized protein n=1 Tax=Ambrosia artemisiifolia TaxID=4212 RepID=A0AAD5GN33_AMBAR|nr:hypothetical protein M8C21_011889 [Ambrosia artemisiifolia]
MMKPAALAEEVERHFGCNSSKLIMVGDRLFTFVIYGNRNRFLTISLSHCDDAWERLEADIYEKMDSPTFVEKKVEIPKIMRKA